jgi:hypothetical protein
LAVTAVAVARFRPATKSIRIVIAAAAPIAVSTAAGMPASAYGPSGFALVRGSAILSS